MYVQQLFTRSTEFDWDLEVMYNCLGSLPKTMLVMLLLQQLVSEITSVIKLSFVHDKNDLEPFSWELGGEKKKKEIYFLLT